VTGVKTSEGNKTLTSYTRRARWGGVDRQRGETKKELFKLSTTGRSERSDNDRHRGGGRTKKGRGARAITLLKTSGKGGAWGGKTGGGGAVGRAGDCFKKI